MPASSEAPALGHLQAWGNFLNGCDDVGMFDAVISSIQSFVDTACDMRPLMDSRGTRVSTCAHMVSTVEIEILMLITFCRVSGGASLSV